MDPIVPNAIVLHSAKSAMMDTMFIKESVIKPIVFLVPLLAHWVLLVSVTVIFYFTSIIYNSSLVLKLVYFC